MVQVYSFPPIENPCATILILGSMPGTASLRARQYYAHPRNAFWQIMGHLVGASPALPYEKRIETLKSSGIALWDVLASCIREGSLDADIDEASMIPNDFERFFASHPRIRCVFFNGTRAAETFRKHVQPSLKARPLQYQRLPSTSPANASVPYERKVVAWEAILQWQPARPVRQVDDARDSAATFRAQ
jgi:TDG/mug DNA glycosylase family protein